MIIHPEPDILKCEVKWILGSITINKASGGDGIPVELFQILKDEAVRVLHSICQQIWKTQQWPQDWKRSMFIPIPEKGNAEQCSNYCTIELISHASKVMIKIFQARLKQYLNCVQMFKLDLEKAEEPEINFPTSLKKQEISRKTSTALLITSKPLTVNHNKLWKIFINKGIPDHLTCLLRNLYVGQEATVRTGHGTTDWFQIGKGVCQGCILSPFLLNVYAEYIMEMLGYIKHKLESRLLEEISVT